MLEEFLRSYVGPTQDDWDELLPLAEYAINNSVHTSTKFTPFFLNSGQHPLNPLTMNRHVGDRRSRLAGRAAMSELPAVKAFVKNIHEAIHKAKLNLKAARDRQKTYADQHRRELTFTVGDQVLLRTKNLKLKTTGSRKLLPKWIGPFQVIGKVGKVAYKLELPDVMLCHPVFHVSNLQPYRSNGSVQPPPMPIEVEGDLEYEVEQILLHRDSKMGSRSKREYLVKWLGFGPEHNSWEPASGMHCDELIAGYWEATHAAQRVRQRRPGSQRSQPTKIP